MNRNALSQMVRQYPLLAAPFLRSRGLWSDADLLDFPQMESSGLTVFEQGNQLIVEAELPG